MRHLAQLLLEQVADGGDPRLPTVDEPGAGDLLGVGGGRRDHGARVVETGRQRLLAEDVLPGREQGLDDRAVQLVRHDDADHMDLVVVEELVPVGACPLVPVPCRGVLRHRLVGVDGRDVAQRR